MATARARITMRHLAMLLLAGSLLPTAACTVGDDEVLDDQELADEAALGANGGAATLKIVQHNIEKKKAVLLSAIQEAKSINADGLTLQEVCPVDTQWLIDNYGSQWTIGVVAAKRPAFSGCDLPDGTHDFPNSIVIWTGGRGGAVTALPLLGGPANAPGDAVCVKFERAKVPVHLCSAHLISADWTDPTTGVKYDGGDLRLKQATKLKQVARDWFGGNQNHFGIIGGDFNGQPDSDPLLKLYDQRLGGTGDFTEYNRNGNSRNGVDTAHADGSNTVDGQPYSKKIDYIFFSTNRAPLDGPAVSITKDGSDHDMVVSTVHMKK